MGASAKRAAELYLAFLKIGCFTFGGGMSIVSQIEKIYVDGKGWISSQELLDIYCVGRSLPGTMVTNVAYLFGSQVGGTVCGAACVLGLITAPSAILVLVARFYDALSGMEAIGKFMLGVRAAVVPIILAAVLKILKPAFPHWACIPAAALAFALFHWLGVNSLVIIGLGMLYGLWVCRVIPRKEECAGEPEQHTGKGAKP